MRNRYLLCIEGEDQEGANWRLRTAIGEAGYDDCGLLGCMHCITTSDSLSQVMEAITGRLEPQDRLVVAPLLSPWAAHNAPSMEDCGRLASLRMSRLRDVEPA
jgi:hypothetical protein